MRGLLTGGESSIAYDGSNFIGNLFYGSDGWMSVDLKGFQIYRGEDRKMVAGDEVQRAAVSGTRRLTSGIS